MKKLERSEMKNLKGGVEDTPGTCTWHQGTTAICNISMATAQDYVNNSGGNWCCDNCPTGLICV